MSGENLNNSIDSKTVEQIRQSPDYAFLVDSLDAAFKDNVWTGLDVDKTADKFMEAVFGREQARAISEDVKRQFYEDYLSKIQELRLGQSRSEIKLKKETGDSQIKDLQEEIEYYEDLRPVDEGKKVDWEKRREDLLDKVRNDKKPTIEAPTLTDWKKLNQSLTTHLGSSFQETSVKDKPELLDKTIKAADSLWRYFVSGKKWDKTIDKKKPGQEIIYLKDRSDCNAKAVLLLIKKSGLEQSVLSNWNKPQVSQEAVSSSLQNDLSELSSQTSSAEVMYRLLQGQGILKNKDEALRLMVTMATKSMHYNLVDNKMSWQGSSLSLRGLHRAFNQHQQYLYLRERVNGFLELKKWRQPLSKKQQAELDQELLNEPVDKSLAAKLINNGKQEETMSRLDKIGQEQSEIIKQAAEVLDRPDEELIKSGQLFVTGGGERWFINQHKKDDKSFGGAVAVRAYGFDGFINYDAERGGYLAVSFKPDSNLSDKVSLPGVNKVNKQMVMHQGNGQNKISLEQLIKEVLPDYKSQAESSIDKTKPFVQLDKESDELPEKFEYNGLQFSRVLTDEELNDLQFLDEVVRSFVEDSVSQVIEQKYGHLDELAKEKILTEMVDKGMNYPKILEQRKKKCLDAKLPLIIDK